MTDIVTPVDADVFHKLLVDTQYDPDETNFVVQGFKKGFSIEYHGPQKRQSLSKNLPLSVGNKTILWNKIMKEVGLKRVASPFTKIPFENYIQSPIGLVPKAGGDGTRLIFHLSYDFSDDNTSVNANTPRELCAVTYSDIDQAVRSILILRDKTRKVARERGIDDLEDNLTVIYLSKSDIKSAFRVLPLSRRAFPWLIMMAHHPTTGQVFYFVDKCLPFGASISCSHFQRVSNALKHIVQTKTSSPVTNYLDDFLFIALTIIRCNSLVEQFIQICDQIGFPVAFDKTEWAAETMTFLGILLDGRNFILSIPIEKREKAEYLLKLLMGKNKATVRELQGLCGFLNFIGRAIFPGRAFTRRMYAKFSPKLSSKGRPGAKLGKQFNLKPYHHIKLDAEFKWDCKVWLEFLQSDLKTAVNRPMIDCSEKLQAHDIGFYSDASASSILGFGSILKDQWIFGKWGEQFIKDEESSIEFLEIFALCAGILTWQKQLMNCRIVVHCDNQAVVSMINNITSSCPNCMYLIRLLTLDGLKHNRRVFATYISSKDNFLSDALSRMQFDRFRKLGPVMRQYPDKIHSSIWPIRKVWNAYKSKPLSL